jgi:MtaA/CmuA family methyltransferase
MRSLDRVRGIIAGNPVDHLPAQPMVMMFAAKHAGIPYIDYTRDARTLAEAQVKVVRDFGIECVLMCSDPAREVIDIAGEGSVKWFEDQGPAIREERAALLDKARLNEFRVPDPHREGRMVDRIRSIEICVEELGGETSIVGWVEGPLALAQELRGLNRIMTDIVDDPAFVRDLMAFTSEVAIVYAAAQIEAGADTIGMSDAAASMIGSRHYGNLVLPWQRRVLQLIRDSHPEVILRQHMCGNVAPLIAQMATLPVDIYELDFPTDLVAARAGLGPERVILGNVSTITDLLEGTPERVEAAASRCHEICGPYHIVGAGCEVSPLTPPENLRAMIRFANRQEPGSLSTTGHSGQRVNPET